jgi:hypothetical protein
MFGKQTSFYLIVSCQTGCGTLLQKRALNLSQNTIVDFDLRGKVQGLYYVKVLSCSGIRVSKILLQ